MKLAWAVLGIGILAIPRVFAEEQDPAEISMRGAAVTASSEAKSGSAKAAFDRNPQTLWKTPPSSHSQWLAVDLGSPQCIDKVRLVWGSEPALRYQLQVSTDGKEWKTVCNTENGRGETEEIANLDVRGRYLRLVCLKPAADGAGYALAEFEAFKKSTRP
ncbi:MAG: discoidin domain-containing protein [Verrucomicrobiae bacterium]|nr:discoidin domain-containing protein [Verrucomicrobiae bacterium]